MIRGNSKISDPKVTGQPVRRSRDYSLDGNRTCYLSNPPTQELLTCTEFRGRLLTNFVSPHGDETTPSNQGSASSMSIMPDCMAVWFDSGPAHYHNPRYAQTWSNPVLVARDFLGQVNVTLLFGYSDGIIVLTQLSLSTHAFQLRWIVLTFPLVQIVPDKL